MLARRGDGPGNVLDHPFSGSECEELVEEPAPCRANIAVAILEVTIGGIAVNVLNNRTRMILQLDKSSIKLIEEWVTPLVKELARSQVDGESSTEGSPSVPVTLLAKFHFSACVTPNVREKVWWNPGFHTWQINEKPKV